MSQPTNTATPKHALRYVRITFSATCLIACVLLIVLWVRSYGYSESVKIPQNLSLRRFEIVSHEGRLTISAKPTPEWWQSVKATAYFRPGMGYSIPGEKGYFGSNGEPMMAASRVTTKPSISHASF